MTTQELMQVKSLFHSPLGLLPFQEESIIRDYLQTEQGGGMLVVWDTGCGKSIFGMRMSTLLAEDAISGVREHDLTIVLCERGKLSEWVEDFENFTDQKVRKHYGPNRLKKLSKEGLPDVLVLTYETAKLDLVRFVKNTKSRGTRIEPGPLFDAIKGKSVLWLCDEIAAKLSNRTSMNYKAFDWTWRQMRKERPNDHRVFGLTATPIETGYENAFNQGRLLFPERMPTVEEFERWMVKRRHPVYKTPKYNEEAIGDFVKLFSPVIDRVRKSEPAIKAQFPAKTERFTRVDMDKDQADLYDFVASLQDPDEAPLPGLFTLLRMVAGHPASVPLAATKGQSKIAKMLVEELGEGYFNRISSAKEKELLIRLHHLIKEEGQKAVVFTFFGQTILPLLGQSMRAAGIKVYENHGALTESEAAQRRRDFKVDPDPCVFLTSDAGCRGINLPEATSVFEFEASLTYANHTQRLDRIHRVTSKADTVHCVTLIQEGTVEEYLFEKMLNRNKQTDLLLGDNDAGEGFITAQDRMAMFLRSRKRK